MGSALDCSRCRTCHASSAMGTTPYGIGVGRFPRKQRLAAKGSTRCRMASCRGSDSLPITYLNPGAHAVKTLDLNEAAAFLHMHPEEVRSRTKRGLIPGAKTGRRWVFLEIDLADFLRSLYPVRRQALQVTNSQEGICHLESAGRSGGSTSSRRVASEYDDLLRPATRSKRKSCTTS